MADPAISHPRPDQDVRTRQPRPGRTRPRGANRRGVRLPGPQRRRQVHHHPHPARPDPADQPARVRVLGLDPRADGVALRRRIGYLAGDFVVDGRQTGRQLLTYLGNLRGGVRAATGSPSWPTASASTLIGRSRACPRATGRRSASCRPSCTSRNCWSWTSRPAGWTRSCSRSSCIWCRPPSGAARRSSCPRT